jgi:ribosomal 50S subunit-recycling heat shock protein
VLLYTKEKEVEVGDIIVIRLHFQQFVSYIMATRLNGENSTDKDNELEINDREN